jgi:ribosomal protein S18 acetylase RimI-like enzyme
LGLVTVQDRGRLASLLSQDAALHLYELGDLEAPYWQHTRWFGWEQKGALRHVALLYTGSPTPVLLAFDREPTALLPLLDGLRPLLPRRLNAQLSPGLAQAFRRDYAITPRGRCLKMALDRPLPEPEASNVRCQPLTPADAARLGAFYAAAHPGNWFEPQQLATGLYRGILLDGQIVSAGGVHVISEAYGVAGLGNIATLPAYRGRGYASAVVRAVACAAQARVGLIGLNVAARNGAALRLYTRLGFCPVAEFDDLGLETR